MQLLCIPHDSSGRRLALIRLLVFLTSFNWLYLPEVIIGSFWHADWAGVYQRAGIEGLLTECIDSLLGTNTWPFFVPLDGAWSGHDVEQLLAHHGIEMWGVGFAYGELFFRVRKSKAEWAQYLMLRAGVPLKHRLLASKSANPSEAASRGRALESKAVPAPHSAPTLPQQFNALVEKIESILDL